MDKYMVLLFICLGIIGIGKILISLAIKETWFTIFWILYTIFCFGTAYLFYHGKRTTLKKGLE